MLLRKIEKYEALAIEIAEKRAAAQKRIDEAKAKVQDVENFAGEADVKAPIGDEKIDGIEEKDSVLLEEDKFENNWCNRKVWKWKIHYGRLTIKEI